MPRPRVRTAYRVAGLYALSFVIVSLLVGGATWGFASHTLRRSLDQRLVNELTTLVRATAKEGQAGLIGDIVARDSVPGDGGYLLADAGGRRIAGRVGVPTPRPGLSDVMMRSHHGGVEAARAAAVILPGGETLAVVDEADTLDHLEHTLLVIATAGFALVVATGVLGGFFVGRSIHRRVQALDLAARAIIDGDLARRMPRSARDDEFDQLSDTLNRMLDHIGRLMDSLRHVSTDIAHDLRTPLARLRATVETAREAPAAEQRERLDDSLAGIDQVMDLFTTILRISEVERHTVREQFREVSLDAVVRDMAEAYGPAVEDSDRVLLVDAVDGTVLRGDEALIIQALSNLIENAIKHTPPCTRIRVTARRDAGRAVLIVADDGPGIPVHQRAAMLRRFGRGETSRSTPGHGLGLTLAAVVAEVHGAELILGDAAPGLSATIRFPAGPTTGV